MLVVYNSHTSALQSVSGLGDNHFPALEASCQGGRSGVGDCGESLGLAEWDFDYGTLPWEITENTEDMPVSHLN